MSIPFLYNNPQLIYGITYTLFFTTGFRNWATNMRQKFAASIFCLCVVYTASIFDDHRFLSLYADPVSCATDSYSRGLSNAMPPLPGMSSSIFSAVRSLWRPPTYAMHTNPHAISFFRSTIKRGKTAAGLLLFRYMCIEPSR